MPQDMVARSLSDSDLLRMCERSMSDRLLVCITRKGYC